MFYVVLKSCSTVKYVILRKEIALNSQVLHRHNASFVGLAWLLPLVSPGWSLVIGTAELSADLSQSPAQGSVAASPAPGTVSCRRHDGAIESAGSGLSILQRRRSSRGPPAAASAPRFLSTASDPAAGHRLLLRFLDSPAPEPALVMSPAAGSFDPPAPDTAAGSRLPVRLLYPQLRIWSRAAGSSITSTGSSCEPTYNRRVVSGHQRVSKRRSASGGRRPS